MNREKNTFTAGIYTLGCKVNQYESEAIAEELARAGVTVIPPNRVADAYVINTCTVTAESDRKARQFIRRAIQKNPNAFIIVTGCLAQTAPETLTRMEGVDAVVGNTDKLLCAKEILRLLKDGKKNSTPSLHVKPIEDAPFEPMRIRTFGRTRAYVKIEDGCENRCAYCIIPSARGPVRSKPADQVIDEVTCLTAGGCREIVLTGIETASYGRDLEKDNLADLLTQVDRIEGIGRIRLGSLDPSLFREEFVRRIASLSSLTPHFHLSLQSGSSRILAKMKRKYYADQARQAMERLRKAMPRVKFTTDVIVGFPGETEEDFLLTEQFVREAEFLMVHIFPYSKRKGTPAERMPDQVPEEVKKERLHRLEKTAKEARYAVLERAIREHPEAEVLFETFKDGYAYGHTDDFLEVAVPSERPLHALLLPVRLSHTDGALCYGELSAHSAEDPT